MQKNSKTKKKNKTSNRPAKPYPDFPLTPHPAGYWCKSIKGKVVYFGRWGRIRNGKMERLPDDGWREALEQYEEERDALYAGRTPRKKSSDDLTVKALCNSFLTAKL